MLLLNKNVQKLKHNIPISISNDRALPAVKSTVENN